MFLIIYLLLIMGATCQQFMSLMRLSVNIDNYCWILDTNNLTQIGMGNCLNQIYYLNLGLGTPPSYFNFQIDTFRDSIWFPLNQTYINSSETFQITNKTAITYLHKNIYEGSYGSDIVTIHQTNISTRSSVVWANKTMDLPDFPLIDGLLGLGYSSTPNFLDNAAMENQISSPIFALQMGGQGQPSVLYYSSLPSFLVDSTLYAPVVGTMLWQVDIENVRIQGFDYSGIVSKTMIIDTNTGLLYLNPSFYKKIIQKFFSQCSQYKNQSIYICECKNQFPQIQFIFDQVSISISPDSYFKLVQHGCLLLIGQTLSEDSPIMMGGSIMKNYIITFDKENKKIGFNGKALSTWKYLFLIFQLILIALVIVALGVSIYLVMTIRYVKMEKLQKIQAKQKKSKGERKSKKQKQKNGNQKILQLTAEFLDQ